MAKKYQGKEVEKGSAADTATSESPVRFIMRITRSMSPDRAIVDLATCMSLIVESDIISKKQLKPALRVAKALVRQVEGEIAVHEAAELLSRRDLEERRRSYIHEVA